MLNSLAVRVHLFMVVMLCVGCGDAAPESAAPTVPTQVESRDRIVSEDGELQLVDGRLSIRSLGLLTDGAPISLLGPVVLDLASDDQMIELAQEVPPGSYSGLSVELDAAVGEDATLQVRVRSDAHEGEVTAAYRGVISGEKLFATGPVAVSTNQRVTALKVSLTQMFFYLYPYTDAVDGHYELTADQAPQLTSNLVYMFDLEIE